MSLKTYTLSLVDAYSVGHVLGLAWSDMQAKLHVCAPTAQVTQDPAPGSEQANYTKGEDVLVLVIDEDEDLAGCIVRGKRGRDQRVQQIPVSSLAFEHTVNVTYKTTTGNVHIKFRKQSLVSMTEVAEGYAALGYTPPQGGAESQFGVDRFDGLWWYSQLEDEPPDEDMM